MREAARSTWYLLVWSLVGIAWGSVLVSLLATGLATLVIVVGGFVLIGTARATRWVERHEAEQAVRFLGGDAAVDERVHLTGERAATLPARVRSEWDRRTMRAAVEGLARLFTGPLLLSVTLVVWLVPLGLMSTPILTASGLEPTEWADHVDAVIDVTEWPAAIAMTVVGLALLPLSALAVRRLAVVVAEHATPTVVSPVPSPDPLVPAPARS